MQKGLCLVGVILEGIAAVLYEFRASLVYRASSRIVRATQRNPVLFLCVALAILGVVGKREMGFGQICDQGKPFILGQVQG